MQRKRWHVFAHCAINKVSNCRVALAPCQLWWQCCSPFDWNIMSPLLLQQSANSFTECWCCIGSATRLRTVQSHHTFKFNVTATVHIRFRHTCKKIGIAELNPTTNAEHSKWESELTLDDHPDAYPLGPIGTTHCEFIPHWACAECTVEVTGSNLDGQAQGKPSQRQCRLQQTMQEHTLQSLQSMKHMHNVTTSAVTKWHTECKSTTKTHGLSDCVHAPTNLLSH